jgi:hypothetical protein
MPITVCVLEKFRGFYCGCCGVVGFVLGTIRDVEGFILETIRDVMVSIFPNEESRSLQETAHLRRG